MRRIPSVIPNPGAWLRRFPIPLLLLFATVAPFARAQDPGAGPRLNREQMWPAPTAEDWKRPVLIPFQRTWEDALAVSKETGKPILICVNMDGEIASEHYAGIRYRSPEIAKLYEPYVCVIASTYRHNPRDYDDEGHRILCPRFGSVTCGEHIAMESVLYKKYFDGKRVAPRHIMIETDGTEKYDIYFRNDTASVFDDIRKGIADRPGTPAPVVRGDRSIVDRVASPDVADRKAVEKAYEDGNQDLRQRLLQAAEKQGTEVPLDLLRLAIFGLDPDLGRLARTALAKSRDPRATDLIADALRVPMDKSDRDLLIAALERLGQTSEKARWLATVHQGLSGEASPVDAAAWAKAKAAEKTPAALPPDAETLMARQEYEARARGENPNDRDTMMKLAEASFDLARNKRHGTGENPLMDRVLARHMFADAREAALRAEKLGAPAWRVNSILALVAYYRGDTDTAYDRAAAAVKDLPAGEPSWNSMAVLTIFGEGRFQAIKHAAKAGRRWPPQWLTDVDAAYSALLDHPFGTDGQVVWHHDFLEWVGVKQRATRVLLDGLRRFPDSILIHAKLRQRLLADRGVDGLEKTYARLIEPDPHPPELDWFAGYAYLIGAEFRRRRGHVEDSLADYARSLELFDRFAAAAPDRRSNADHYAAIVLAAEARLALEAGDLETALARIEASFVRRPESAGTTDGLGITPVSTAQMLLQKLKDLGRDGLAVQLDAALNELDPALLAPEEK